MSIEGIWLPIITPFKNDKVDFEAYKNLIDYYISKGICGLIPMDKVDINDINIRELPIEDIVKGLYQGLA